MSCRCSPSLVRLMADFAKFGHVNSGCCGDAAHQARKSDHNADSSGYAHAQDIHEKADHDMQPYVDFIMANPRLFPQVKYLIYEGFIYYPNDGARKAGKYRYTGPNAHAHHLHVSIFDWATNHPANWYVIDAYNHSAPPTPEEDDVKYRYWVTGKPNEWWVTDLIVTRRIAGTTDLAYLETRTQKFQDDGQAHPDFHASLKVA